jgi:hypothetical protein
MGTVARLPVTFAVVNAWADSYRFGWDYASMAITPGFLLWRIRDWNRDDKSAALAGYTDRRNQYAAWDVLGDK